MFDRLIGNTRLKKMLACEIQNGSLAHAYIIEGCEGIGKHTLAYEIAAALADADDEGVIRMKEGRCPDIRVIGLAPDRKTIGIETVRDIGYHASVTPNEFDFKLTVIENADLMTVQAQNAFLKLLEEPPKDVYFLMLCENSSAMLPTVRSRAPIIRMERCNSDEIDLWLSENNNSAATLKRKDKQAYESLLRLADGCIGKALLLFGSASSFTRGSVGSDKNIATKAKEIISCVKDRRTAPLIKCIYDLGSDRTELCAVLSSFTAALRDMILCKTYMMNSYISFDDKKTDTASIEELCFYTDNAVATSDSEMLSMAELVKMADCTAYATDRLLMNGNARQILTEFVCRLKKIVC